MNLAGLVAACAAFAGIWAGHVAVRKVEAAARVLLVPAAVFVLGGVLLEALALSLSSPALSAALGILGITLLWDAIELFRQERRVQKGHAPANPGNPRHKQMLDSPGTQATTLDLLKRAPLSTATMPVPAGSLQHTDGQGPL